MDEFLADTQAFLVTKKSVFEYSGIIPQKHKFSLKSFTTKLCEL